MLELVRITTHPSIDFRFVTADVPPDVDKPVTVTLQINPDRGGDAFFLRVGDDVPGTNFRLRSFKPGRELRDGRSTIPEVVIANKATGEEKVLRMGARERVFREGAVFRYHSAQPEKMQKIPDFSRFENETFTLPPDHGKTCKVLAIKGRGVVIELPDGTKRLLTLK